MESLDIKVGDVYTFRYFKSDNYEYHCFDGTLIVKERDNGDKYLEDTYWDTGGSRVFHSVNEALEKGELTFLFNFDMVEEVSKYMKDYYSDTDFFELYIHAGYRNRYFIKKGAKRSKEKMLEVLENKMKDTERQIESLKYTLTNLNENFKKVNGGDLDIYI